MASGEGEVRSLAACDHCGRGYPPGEMATLRVVGGELLPWREKLVCRACQPGAVEMAVDRGATVEVSEYPSGRGAPRLVADAALAAPGAPLDYLARRLNDYLAGLCDDDHLVEALGIPAPSLPGHMRACALCAATAVTRDMAVADGVDGVLCPSCHRAYLAGYDVRLHENLGVPLGDPGGRRASYNYSDHIPPQTTDEWVAHVVAGELGLHTLMHCLTHYAINPLPGDDLACADEVRRAIDLYFDAKSRRARELREGRR